MTEFETPEDEWARGVFDRVRGGGVRPEPHWAPDAATATRTSTRHRRRVRMTGALTAAAVIGVSATAFATLGGGSAAGGTKLTPGSSSAPPHGLPASQSAPNGGDAAKLAKYVTVYASGPYDPNGGGPYRVPTATATMIDGILTTLDPGLVHLRTPNATVVASIGPEPGNRRADTIGASSYWTPDGDSSKVAAIHKSSPLGLIRIQVSSPRTDKWPELRNAPCGLTEVGQWDPGLTAAVTWSSCNEMIGPDSSSIVTTHSVNLAAGQVNVAARVFPDGSAVTITASNYLVYVTDEFRTMLPVPQPPQTSAGTAVTPTPFSDHELAVALLASDVKALP